MDEEPSTGRLMLFIGSPHAQTDREIEVLRWTADGKTASEIADILNISERTANFHIANVITKLNAPNKTAAVIRAGMLGMLS